MPPALAHVNAWIFDLDNTLYPARTNLFAQIDVRMGAYIERLLGCTAAEARRVQKGFFHEHGTTLSGLMAEHAVEPHEFLEFVHDIEMDVIAHDAVLVRSIAALPGRKLVFTNGDAPYAQRVLDRLGLGASFEAIHDIHAMAYVPKPVPASYLGLCHRWGIDPARALFAEDMVRNLAPAKAIGMTTVWIDNGSEQAGATPCPSFVDYRAANLGDWLVETLGDA
ncbi:MAG: pyrimidine 5'-nucleotidase [Sphingomonadaceae bacterium]